MPRLRDIVIDRPRVLFVGINPSPKTVECGHHFAGRGNPFWRLMSASGLVPFEIDHTGDRRIVELGFAMTNLCRRATRAASELSAAELNRGKSALQTRIRRMKPEMVAFVGVSIYRLIFGSDSSPGAGIKPEAICGARIFVLPNPSGLNASYPGFRDKLVWFERLRAELDAAG
jgi:TDG/mug DNA glycosylase family protein